MDLLDLFMIILGDVRVHLMVGFRGHQKYWLGGPDDQHPKLTKFDT